MLFLELKSFFYNKKFLVHYERTTHPPNADRPHSFQKRPGIIILARETQDLALIPKRPHMANLKHT